MFKIEARRTIEIRHSIGGEPDHHHRLAITIKCQGSGAPVFPLDVLTDILARHDGEHLGRVLGEVQRFESFATYLAEQAAGAGAPVHSVYIDVTDKDWSVEYIAGGES